jgi:uncharacterized protein
MYVSKTVTDARSGGSGDKTSADRQRFIRRAKAQIKEAVKKAISTGDIKSLEQGKIKVPVKDMDEPVFEHDPNTGSRDRVVTGNKSWIPGDKIPKPEDEDGDGSGGDRASQDGEGRDDFVFVLTPEEFYEFLFEDLALPDLMKKSMKTITKVVRRRAGYVISGNPAQLDIRQTYKFAFARHKALGRPSGIQIEEQEALVQETAGGSNQFDYEFELDKLQQMKSAQSRIPLIDDIDLRYRNYPPRPEPITKAVMVCMMDVSGSMDENRKDLAKRFYLLLYVWLMKQYNKRVEIVFIRYHSQAEEVTEQQFFYDDVSGGTVVSPSIDVCMKVIRERYSPADWNIYACMASDGDNWVDDNKRVEEKMQVLMPLLQYFAYLQVTPVSNNSYGGTLWQVFEKLKVLHQNLNQVVASEPEQIWTVFKELFTRDQTK